MRLLAIDTGSEACSVGVADGERAWICSELVGRGHAERLMGMIERTLADASIDVADARSHRGHHRAGLVHRHSRRRRCRARPGARARPKAVGIGTLAVHAEAARALAGRRRCSLSSLPVAANSTAQCYDAQGAERVAPLAATPDAFAAMVSGGIDRRLRQDRLILAGSGADLVLAALGRSRRARPGPSRRRARRRRARPSGAPDAPITGRFAASALPAPARRQAAGTRRGSAPMTGLCSRAALVDEARADRRRRPGRDPRRRFRAELERRRLRLAARRADRLRAGRPSPPPPRPRRLVAFVLVRFTADEAEILTDRRRSAASAAWLRPLTDGGRDAPALSRADRRPAFSRSIAATRPPSASTASLGFVVAGERRSYYATPAAGDGTALVMRLQVR